MIAEEKIKRGKQNEFVNFVVKDMDEEIVGGENLFGESNDDIDVGKVDHIVQLGNLHIDREKFYNPQNTRVHSPKGCCPTLTLSFSPLFLLKDDGEYRVRCLTGFEEMRLMGCEDEDIQKLVDGGISNNQLCQLAGNSIVVDVMAEFYKEMIKH